MSDYPAQRHALSTANKPIDMYCRRPIAPAVLRGSGRISSCPALMRKSDTGIISFGDALTRARSISREAVRGDPRHADRYDARFAIDLAALSAVDSTGRRRIVAGRGDLWVGGGLPATARERVPGATARLTVAGTRDLD